MLTIAIVAMAIFLILGVPVSFAIGLSGLMGVLLGGNAPVFQILQQLVRGINSFPLMAVPFFVLAGEILGGAQLSSRIIDFCRTLVSWMKGGLGIVCVLANMIFAGITGSGAAAISAIGGITAPEMEKAGYDRSFIASLVGGAGALGPIIPPSVNMIVFGSLTGVSVGRMFMGGVVPGLVIGAGLMILCTRYAQKYKVDLGGGTFDPRLCWQVFKKSFFALVAPVIMIGGVIGGVFTATEAGVVSCIYGLICGFFIYRTLKLKDLIPVFRRATESTAMIMMLLATGSIYGYIFAVEQVGQKMSAWLISVSETPLVILAIIVGVVLIAGCFLEMTAVTVVMVPIIFPVIQSLGIDVVHFGVLFVVACIVGGITPPVGLYLFMAMDVTKAPFNEAIRYTIPVVAILTATVLLIMFVPGVATLIPNLVM